MSVLFSFIPSSVTDLSAIASATSAQQHQINVIGTSAACDLTADGSRTGNCTNVVKGDGAIGTLLSLQDGVSRYAIKTIYSGELCDGIVLLEETFRVGDGVCYADIDGGGFRRFVSACGGSDIVTLRYAGASCQDKALSFDTALTGVDKCFASDVRQTNGASYRLVISTDTSGVAPPITESAVQGYVENMYTDTDACENAAAAPVLRRAYSNACIATSVVQQFTYDCRKAITVSYDRVSDAVAFMRPCGSSSSTGHAQSNNGKTVLFASPQMGHPTSTCKPRTDFLSGDVAIGILGEQLRDLQTFRYTVSCLASPSAEFEQELRDQVNQWIITVVMSSLSLVAGLIVLSVIAVMFSFRWSQINDFVRLVAIMTAFQVLYDVSFLLPLQRANEPASTSYINSAYRSAFLNRWFSMACIFMSNMLASVVGYVVIFSKAFSLKNIITAFTIVVLIISLVPAVMMTVYADRIRVTPDDENQKRSFSQTLIGLRGMQMAGIIFNLIMLGFTGFKFFSLGKKRSISYPLAVLCLRMGLYPAVQMITQFPLIWDTFSFQLNSKFSGPKDDDAFFLDPTYHFRSYSFVYAFFAPSAGLLFAMVFLYFQPKTKEVLVRMSQSICDSTKCSAICSVVLKHFVWTKNEISANNNTEEDVGSITLHKQERQMSMAVLHSLSDDDLVNIYINESSVESVAVVEIPWSFRLGTIYGDAQSSSSSSPSLSGDVELSHVDVEGKISVTDDQVSVVARRGTSAKDFIPNPLLQMRLSMERDHHPSST